MKRKGLISLPMVIFALVAWNGAFVQGAADDTKADVPTTPKPGAADPGVNQQGSGEQIQKDINQAQKDLSQAEQQLDASKQQVSPQKQAQPLNEPAGPSIGADSFGTSNMPKQSGASDSFAQPQAGHASQQNNWNSQKDWNSQQRGAGGSNYYGYQGTDRSISSEFDRDLSDGYWSGSNDAYYQGSSRSTQQRSTKGSAIYGYSGTDEDDAFESQRAWLGLGEDADPRSERDNREQATVGMDMDANVTHKMGARDADDYFYTRYWKVDMPPIAAHPRFETPYDNALSRQYYTTWSGSSEQWTPNQMTLAPMPRPSGQVRNLVDSQRVTYFQPWKKALYTDAPNTFLSRGPSGTGTIVMETARTDIHGSQGDQIYGFQESSGPKSEFSRDGAIHTNGRTLYWDDLDIVSGGSSSVGAGNLGFIPPSGDASASAGGGTTAGAGTFNPGTTFRDEKDRDFTAKPDSRDQKLYGSSSGQVYGYVDTDRSSTDRSAVKKDHHDHDDMDDHDDRDVDHRDYNGHKHHHDDVDHDD